MKTISDYIKEELMQPNAFVILKPGFLEHTQEWLDMLMDAGWEIIQQKRIKLTHEEAEELYKMHKDKDFYADLCDYMSSDDCIAVCCYKDVKDPIKTMGTFKDTIRDKWGKSEMKNAMHSSDSLANVKRECKLIFDKK